MAIEWKILNNTTVNRKLFLASLLLTFSVSPCLAKTPQAIPQATPQKKLQPVVEKKDKPLEQIINEMEVKEVAKKRKKEDKKGIFSVVLENDLFTGTDRGYTNGIRFSYATSEENMPKLVRNAASYLPMLAKDGKKRIIVAAGQSMFTPADITTPEAQPNDYPYSGWLYSSFGINSDTDDTLDTALLTLGVVGPSAQGEQTQKFVHHQVAGAKQPQGWSHQLHDEPGIIFSYERKWRNVFEISPLGIQIDAIPQTGINLGNISTNASIGTIFRIGRDLPSDYGPPRIRPGLPGSDFFIPSKEINGYLFCALEGRAVARNIFLDGNTFQHSQSVEKRILVGTLQLGATLAYKNTRISYTHVFVSQEFKGQVQNPQFGAVTVSYRF